ncbi:SanA/YdcF family protein [Sorangium sp. So ce131]|uniref:SanA/YdcF family protein n=1 Tax=Sorangium sp. So ce131 TaxID=3133282 RepID=UPI003F5FFB3B
MIPLPRLAFPAPGRVVRLTVMTLLLLVLAGGAALGGARLWVGRSAEIYRDAGAVPPREVAIVPGALVWPDGTPSPVLADRLAAALELHRAGKVRRILVSGDHGRVDYDEPNAMRAWLVRRGVPSGDVFMDHAGLRTLDTMQRAARVFGVRDAVVCTQAFHLPRALYLARAAGFPAVGYAADRRVYANAERDAQRELLATALTLLDTLSGRGPRFLGPPVPIDGDARASHDAWTRGLVAR